VGMRMKEKVPRKKFGDEDGILFSVPPDFIRENFLKIILINAYLNTLQKKFTIF
jgi:hypothetical protein